MGASYVAGLEKSADGTNELFCSLSCQQFLSISAVEICQQPPSASSLKPADYPSNLILSQGDFINLS